MISAFEQTLQKQFGLNINEIMLLCIVSDRRNISSGEVAKEMELTHSNTSKVLASLEQKKLICRHLRCMKFSITKNGETLLANINCDHVELPECLKVLISAKK